MAALRLFQHRVGEGRMGQEHGHAGGALHPQPVAGRGERDVHQRLVQRVDAGVVDSRNAHQLPPDLSRSGLRRQHHARSRADPEPPRHRIADEGVETVAVLQVAAVDDFLPQPRKGELDRGLDTHDQRGQRPFGRGRQAPGGDPHRGQRRIGNRGVGDHGHRRLHLGGREAVRETPAVPVSGRVEGDVPRCEPHAGVDPVLVGTIGERAREDQQRQPQRHGGGGQGAAPKLPPQVAQGEPCERAKAHHQRSASASAGGTRTARQAGRSAETIPVPTSAIPLTRGPSQEYSTVSWGRTAEPAKE